MLGKATVFMPCVSHNVKILLTEVVKSSTHCFCELSFHCGELTWMMFVHSILSLASLKATLKSQHSASFFTCLFYKKNVNYLPPHLGRLPWVRFKSAVIFRSFSPPACEIAWPTWPPKWIELLVGWTIVSTATFVISACTTVIFWPEASDLSFKVVTLFEVFLPVVALSFFNISKSHKSIWLILKAHIAQFLL